MATRNESWMPKKLKAFLITGTERIEVTKDVMNWRELDVNLERDGLTGTFVEIGNKLQLCRKGRDILHDVFMTTGLASNVIFEIQKRGPRVADPYAVILSMVLSFAEYAENKDYVEISGVARTFNSLFKSFGKTKYDIAVNDLPKGGIDNIGVLPFVYSRQPKFCIGSYTVAEQTADNPLKIYNAEITTLSISVNEDKTEQALGGRQDDIVAQKYMQTNPSEGVTPATYFFKAIDYKQDSDIAGDYDKSNPVQVNIRFKFKVNVPVTQNYNMALYLQPDGFRNPDPVDTITVADYLKGTVDIDFNRNITLKEGYTPVLYVSRASNTLDNTLYISDFEYFEVSYVDTPMAWNKTVIFPAVPRSTLINALLDKMSNGDPYYKYTAVIDTDPFSNGYWDDDYLVSAESIIGRENPYFHASVDDFLKYMQFLGYEWVIDESTKTVHFQNRDTYFSPNVTALELGKNEMADLMMKADEDNYYTSLKIGYDKADVDGEMSNFIVFSQNDYTTGKVAPMLTKSNTLEIKCPYVADPLIIEKLLLETDKSKDNDDIIMLVGEVQTDTITNPDGTEVAVFRAYPYSRENLVVSRGDINLKTMINAPYIPAVIAMRNNSKLAIATDTLTYVGSDGIKGGIIGYQDLRPVRPTNSPRPSLSNSNIALSNPLFTPIIYDFAAGTHLDLPMGDARNGLVKFWWKGQQYQGYIRQLVKNNCAETETTWQLHAKV